MGMLAVLKGVADGLQPRPAGGQGGCLRLGGHPARGAVGDHRRGGHHDSGPEEDLGGATTCPVCHRPGRPSRSQGAAVSRSPPRGGGAGPLGGGVGQGRRPPHPGRNAGPSTRASPTMSSPFSTRRRPRSRARSGAAPRRPRWRYSSTRWPGRWRRPAAPGRGVHGGSISKLGITCCKAGFTIVIARGPGTATATAPPPPRRHADRASGRRTPRR